MTRLTNEKRLVRAQQVRAKAEQDVRRVKKDLRDANRKADTRRKIILGGALLDSAKTQPGIARYVRVVVERLERDGDKAAFADFALPAPLVDDPEPS